MDYIAKALLDADAADWITVAAYLVVAALSLRAARWAYLKREERARIFWAASCGALLFLGINELLDLQTLLTAAAKMHAQSNGWYEDRKPIQYAFILALSLAAVLITLVTFFLVRSLSAPIKLAVAGYIFIGVFILFRAASFHRLDQLLGSGYQAFNLGSIQEMAGIVIIAVGSMLYARQPNSAERNKG